MLNLIQKTKHSTWFVNIVEVEVIDHKAVGAALRKVREDSDLSLRSVADKMKKSVAFISDLELGRRNWTKQLHDDFLGAVLMSIVKKS